MNSAVYDYNVQTNRIKYGQFENWNEGIFSIADRIILNMVQCCNTMELIYLIIYLATYYSTPNK